MLEALIWVASHHHHLRHVAGGRTDFGWLLDSHLIILDKHLSSIKEFTFLCVFLLSRYLDIFLSFILFIFIVHSLLS